MRALRHAITPFIVSVAWGCATATVVAPAGARPEAVAIASARRAVCAGVVIELHERIGDWSRHATLRCDERGATVEIAEGGIDAEGSFVRRELDVAEADALWAEIAALSTASLSCGPGEGTDTRRLDVIAPRRARTFECAGDPPEGWTTLEHLLAPEASGDVDEDAIWPFQSSDFWTDELGDDRASSRVRS